MTGPEENGSLQSALFTDLYELTMAQAYLAEAMRQEAVFELFFRKLPQQRNYIVAAGVQEAVAFLESWRFDEGDVQFLRETGRFSADFLQHLRDFRFEGDVYAVAEGTPVFPNEPLLQVVAPLPEAQIVETCLLNQLHFQSVLASKAARVISAAAGRPVVDFGSRRAHGFDAALQAARTSYLVGAAGTSNVLAGRLYGIPLFGTMAHSYIQAHDEEAAAFAGFAAEFPGTTLLVDTYDTLRGIETVIELSRREPERFRINAVRLDSGDLAFLAKEARRKLDAAGLEQVTIFASGGLDEYRIHDLLADGAPIDGFGVGTHMTVSDDAPDLDMAYKLVEYAGRPRTKLSAGKQILPGRKQVYRQRGPDGILHDVIGVWGEELPGDPLLQPVMQGGRRLPAAAVPLAEARRFTLQQLQDLPSELRGLMPASRPFRVEVSEKLQQQMQRLHVPVGNK